MEWLESIKVTHIQTHKTHSRTHIQTHTNAQNTHTFIFIKVILYSYLKKMNEHITDS